MRLDRDRLDRRGERQPTISFSDDQARLVCEPCVPDDDSAKHTHTHHSPKRSFRPFEGYPRKGQQLFSNTKINPSACIHARRTFSSSTR